MDSESPQKLAKSSLSLLKECLTHVVKIPSHLLAWEWLGGRKMTKGDKLREREGWWNECWERGERGRHWGWRYREEGEEGEREERAGVRGRNKWTEVREKRN